MASALTVTEIDTLALDMIQANVATNARSPPLASLEAYNNAYQEIWSLSGGRKKNVTSATAWAAAQTTTSGHHDRHPRQRGGRAARVVHDRVVPPQHGRD